MDTNQIPFFFDNCMAVVEPAKHYTETIFDDKTKVPALPEFTESYKWHARDLGYFDKYHDNDEKTALGLMSIHHELLHTFLSESAGFPYSPTLWSVAHDQTGPGCIPIYRQYEEEALVLSFQKYLNTELVDPVVENFTKLTNLDLNRLRRKAFDLLSIIK